MKETTQQQTLDILEKTVSYRTFTIWFVGVSFTLFQFFLQLSSGVILSTIMTEMNLSALLCGLLGSSFYYVYTTLQIPVGIFYDRYQSKVLITVSASLCALGCILFSLSHTFNTLLFSRLLIGAGSSFAFVGLSHLLRVYFPLKYFALLLGLSETLAFTITALGIANLSQIIHQWGWRLLMMDAGLLALFIAVMAWIVIPKTLDQTSQKLSTQNHPLLLFSNVYLWLNGLFVFLSFTTITVFGAMWAVPFIQIKLHCTLNQAAQIDSWLFLGAALSCPLAGFLCTRLKTHQPVTVGSALTTSLLIFTILHLNTETQLIYTILMFLTGLFSGGYMLAFSISNGLVPLQERTTATGFTNTMAMLSAPLFIPLVGYLSDFFRTQGYSSFLGYQFALSCMPVLLLLAASIALILPNPNNT